MRAPNEDRGEFEIVLAGETYGMRPSSEAITAYEKATGRSNAELYLAASANTMSKDDAAIVVTECVKAWGRAAGDELAPQFKVARVGDLLIESDGGLLLVKRRLEAMLYMAETGGVTSSGEARAIQQSPKTAADAGSAGSPAPRSGGRRTSGGKRPQSSSTAR